MRHSHIIIAFGQCILAQILYGNCSTITATNKREKKTIISLSSFMYVPTDKKKVSNTHKLAFDFTMQYTENIHTEKVESNKN